MIDTEYYKWKGAGLPACCHSTLCIEQSRVQVSTDNINPNLFPSKEHATLKKKKKGGTKGNDKEVVGQKQGHIQPNANRTK